MKNKSKWMVSLICLLIGFMAAIQYQTVTAQPEMRDTRGTWEVREDILKQQEIQQNLLEKIESSAETIHEYEAKSSHGQLEILKRTIYDLKEKAGLTEVEGEGVLLRITPIFQENPNEGQVYPTLSPLLLSQLINELNTYGAEELAIGNERFTNLSPVRNVNGSTYINNRPLPSLPFTISVITEQPEKLKDYMEASQSITRLAFENIGVQVEVKQHLTLPEYSDPVHLELFEETGE